ncbi:MAG TPA: SpoIIE family protein phosphatase [Verrucomicrobiae bacterium]|nr:SpoIIE family protein phosphatase [Verrucomicrobiae bacterium]
MIRDLVPLEGSQRAPMSTKPRIVENVARLCADAFADLCAVYLFGSPSGPVVFCTRVPGAFPALQDAPLDGSYIKLAQEAGLAPPVCQPLIVDGAPAGSVVLASAREASSSVTPAMALMVATILSEAIGQGALLAHHHRVSERLQRAMLPERLVQGPGISFDAAYWPASRDAVVGGDWYDAFEVSDGKIGISVGDVTGHGLEAAVTMSEIRSAIRAAAATHQSPSALLNAVESMVSSQCIGVASAIAGIFDPVTGILRYACAGHPPPVLVTASGVAYILPGGGLLLGLGEPVASGVRTVTIAPGASCYFYTDGLTEHARDPVAGEEQLVAAIEHLAATDTLDAHELHMRIIAEGPNLDDCATLLLRRAAAPPMPVERYTYSAVPNSARIARDAIRSYAEQHGMNRADSFDIVLAAGEAIANAIEYGAHSPEGTFTVELVRDDAELQVSVESEGHWRSTPSHKDRGRGMQIMRACAKNVEVSSTAERTHLTLAFSSR